MYKDKDKQREANRRAQARFKAKGITSEGITGKGITEKEFIKEVAKIYNVPERTERGNVWVSKPGDADYVPQCKTSRTFIYGRDKRPETAKRGKNIKCFADLPPDVRRIIEKMSTVEDSKIDQTIKANRTAIAIHYQHLFPERYYSTGIAI